VPPPDAPVAAIRFGSTSGNDVKKSVALMLFHRWSPIDDPMFHNSWRESSQSWGTWLVSFCPTMS
jgi:hypothetical protein